jgi:aromatic-L-amino-acid decarboxylase
MEALQNRKAPLEMDPSEFRRLGHWLIDHLADFLQSLPRRPVTPGPSPGEVRALLGNRPLPQKGMAAGNLLQEAASLLFDHSLFNGQESWSEKEELPTPGCAPPTCNPKIRSSAAS